MAILQDIAFILGTMLMYASPLIYTALGGVISENSGVINIGLEGMMTIGAFFAAMVGYFTGNPWLGFLAGGLAGGALAVLHAVACVIFDADNVISGIAIIFIGPGLSLFLSRLFFDGATQTKALDLSKKIPRPFNGVFEQNSPLDLVFNQYAVVYIAIFLVFLISFLLYKTRIGLRLRAVGEQPNAALTMGIRVRMVRFLAVVISGVLAGFGGATLSIAIVSLFWGSLISGQGFIALAAMIFGKWRPIPTMFACFLFGIAQGIVVYVGARVQGTISDLLSMLPYVLTLIVLTSLMEKGLAPEALGKPLRERL